MTDAPKNNPIARSGDGADSAGLGFGKIDTDRLSQNSMIKVDYALYADFLEGSEASEEDKRAFVQTVWNIIFAIASLGFEAHPVQVIKKICGKSAFHDAACAKGRPKVVE